MSNILYYSNYCEKCKNMLQQISKSSIKNEIHFICIDKRVREKNTIKVVLENGQKVTLPNSITKVPALLLLNKNQQVIFGEEIFEFLQPVIHTTRESLEQPNYNGEPSAFQITNSMSGVSSDNYSFWDTQSEDLSAKGNGGLRQMHNYTDLNASEKIYCPPDDYVPDKIGNQTDLSMENIIAEREKEIPQVPRQM